MGSARKNSAKGYLCVIAAAVMWASSGTAGKALFNGGMTAFELVQIRVTLSAALMGVYLFLFSRDLMRIRRQDLGYFLLLGAVAMGLCQGSYFFAISKIHVAAAILLQYLAPILIAVFSVLFWEERLTFFKTASLILAFGGCYLVVGGYDLQLLHMNRIGILAGLTSAVSFAGYSLLGERGMHRYNPWTVLFYAMVFATLTWHVIYDPFHYLTAGFSPVQWGWIFYITVVGTVLPFGLFLVGINFVRSTRASITATLEPISAGVMAFIILGEALQALQILGGILVIGAVVLLQLQKEQDEKTPALIRARKG